MIKQLLIFLLVGIFAHANAQTNAIFKGNIGDKKATLCIYPSDGNWADGYGYFGDGKDAFFRVNGKMKKQGNEKVYDLSVIDWYFKNQAKLKGNLKGGVMQGVWTSADGKETSAYKLVLQPKNKDLSQQIVYQQFKQRFRNINLPLTQKTKTYSSSHNKFTQQELTLFFASFDLGELTIQPTGKVQHQAYARFGPYQSAFVPLYQVSHRYQSRFDILIMTIFQKDGGASFSPWSTNTFVVTYDKYGNYISSALLSYHTGAMVPATSNDSKKKKMEYEHIQESGQGKFNQRLQIVTQSKTLMEGGKKKQLVYQVLPNGYIVLL